MTEERTGEAFELGEVLTVIGGKLTPGADAPDFALDWLDPADAAIHTVSLSDTARQVRLLNVINSVDTPVCHIETHHWDTLRAALPSTVAVYSVSMDLPFAQERWAKAEGVSHPLLSAHRDTKFAEDYGILIKEWRLLQRAVFVVDKAGRIAYAEYVADQMAEPDYDAAIQAARQAAA